MIWSQHDTLAVPVERTLTTRQDDPEADTTALEQEIDRLVYQLYDLTPDEIAVVEESTRARTKPPR